MGINSAADMRSAARQTITIYKSSGQVATPLWQSSWMNGGLPGSGGSSLGVTTSGAVPVSGDTGVPDINPLSGTSKILSVDMSGMSLVAGFRILLYDRLFHAGTYAYNAGTVSLTSQPSFGSRLPGGSYAGTMMFVEAPSNLNGSPVVTVTYTNQSGTPGQSTSVSVPTTAGIATPIPFASGDCGVQKIESVSMSGATSAGSYNVVVARPLWVGRVDALANALFKLDGANLPDVYQDSALACLMRSDTSSGPAYDLRIEIGTN